MRTLVTGANGFLGSWICRVLAARGIAPRMMILPGTDVRALAGIQGEVVEADLLRPDTLGAPMRGIEWVFHTAGTTDEWERTPGHIHRVNVDGTRNVCEAALASGVRRLVHTSSAAASASTPPHRRTHEDDPWNLADTGPYSASKHAGEQVARSFGDRGLEVVALLPHQILGAWDTKPSAPGALVVRFLQRALPAVVDVASQFVAVEDVAEAHVAAAERGRAGHRYLLGGPEVVSASTFVRTLGELTGLRAPHLRVPVGLLLPVAYAAQAVADHVTHRPPPLTVGNARMLAKRVVLDTSKAERELGFRPRDWRVAAAAAVRWFVENGYAPRPPRLPA